MMVLKYALRFNLNHSALKNLFRMINRIFAKPFLPDSRYLVDMMFVSKDITCYYSICPHCGAYVGTYERSDVHKDCKECGHRIKLHDSSYTTFFVTYSVENEIKQLIETNDKYYNHTVKERIHENGVYRDIYDGQMYRKFVNNLDLGEEDRYITLTFNSDGVPVFKSPAYSIWPIQLIVNETPLNIRISKTIVFALWFGKNKPDMSVFQNAFVDEINDLSKSGIPCTILGEERLVIPYALCCCVDTVARAPMQGIVQFNGKYGCNWCLHPGEWMPNKDTQFRTKFLKKEMSKIHLLRCRKLSLAMLHMLLA